MDINIDSFVILFTLRTVLLSESFELGQLQPLKLSKCSALLPWYPPYRIQIAIAKKHCLAPDCLLQSAIGIANM